MKTQRSRNSFDAAKRYSGVYQQMGRMLTDADWNELSDLAKSRLADALTDLIGSGIPRERGMVETTEHPDGSKRHALRWGYVYVDGIIAQVRPDPAAALADPGARAFEYEHQADFPGAPPRPEGEHKLYLDVWERTVLVLEDDELRDAGLQGADTCTRTQTMAQVKWCESSVDPELAAQNPPIGEARLTLTLREGSAGDDPCDPCAETIRLQGDVGNYLFRVEVHEVGYDDGGRPERVTIKWSRENGAEQYAIDQGPPGFESDNWAYEFFDGFFDAEAATPETFDSEKHLGRHLATGFTPTRGALTKGYPDAVPGGYSAVRRWDGYCELLKRGGNWTLVDGVDRGVDLSADSGIDAHGYVAEAATVAINLDAITLGIELADRQLLAGDYWQAAVRQAVHSAGSRLITDEPPHGILHHYLTLGIVAADGRFTPHASGHCAGYRFPPLTDIGADDVCYEVPSCGDAAGGQATVRRLLEERLGDDFPDPGAAPVSAILDALLCRHSAATLPLLKNPALCPTLQDDAIQSVQDALNELCVLKASGCASITVFPGPDWMRPIVDLPRGQDASICFRPGDYVLEDTLLVEGKGHLKISGAGPGTRIVCRSREAALHLSGCPSVHIGGLSIEAGAVGNGGRHDHLFGALTITDCGKVTIEHAILKCAAGTRLGATCLTVGNGSRRSGSVSVTGCELSVGHRQVGMLLLNMQHGFVQNNRIKVRPKPKSLTLERQLTDAKFAANARKLLINNAVIRNFEAAPAGLKNVHMSELNNRRMLIRSPVSGADWRSAIMDQAAGTTLRSNQELLGVARKVAKRALTDDGFRARFRAFGTWFEALRAQNPASAHTGIVCGGQVARDVQILDNAIEGAQEGIHVGLSDHSLGIRRVFTAGRVSICGNSINLIVPPAAERRRGGLFVGNCNNLTVQDNQILAQRFPLSRNISLEGIRVFGHFGRMMILRQNYMTRCNVGIRIRPVEVVEGGVQWLVSDNMMPNADPPVDAPAAVRKYNNKA